MTISSVLNRASYSGNGVTTAFSFPYKFLQNADLVVIERVTATGVETVKTITTDYTVTGAGESGGGTVTMLVAPASGKTLTIYRDPSPVQGLDLVENDPLPADDLEESLDLLTMLAQRLSDLSDRTVRLSDGFTATFDTTLPSDLTANTVVVINEDGDGFSTGPDISDIEDASGAATDAAASAAAAATSALLAQDWATKTASEVITGQFSSKEWAVGILNRGLASGGSAKDWATYTGGTVDNSEYSSKYYAQQAATTVSNLDPSLVATENIASGGTISINTKYVQNRKVQGNGGAQTASTTPFGSSIVTDGIAMRLIGQSDTNILTIPYSDTNYGCLLNGDAELAKGNVLSLLFDLTALRWYEVSRNF